MCQCMCGGVPTSRQMLFCACSSYSCPAMYSFLGGEGVYHVLYAVLSVLTNQVAEFQGADRLSIPLCWDINFTSKLLLRWTLFLMNYKTKWTAFFVAINGLSCQCSATELRHPPAITPPHTYNLSLSQRPWTRLPEALPFLSPFPFQRSTDSGGPDCVFH